MSISVSVALSSEALLFFGHFAPLRGVSSFRIVAHHNSKPCCHDSIYPNLMLREDHREVDLRENYATHDEHGGALGALSTYSEVLPAASPAMSPSSLIADLHHAVLSPSSCGAVSCSLASVLHTGMQIYAWHASQMRTNKRWQAILHVRLSIAKDEVWHKAAIS